MEETINDNQKLPISPESTGDIQKVRTPKGRFVKGQSGNPAGKPKGAKNKFSFTGYWQERWENNPKEFQTLATAFMNDKNLSSLIIQMVDGRPQQDVTTAGEKLPTPLLAIPDVLRDLSDKEATETQEED